MNRSGIAAGVGAIGAAGAAGAVFVANLAGPHDQDGSSMIDALFGGSRQICLQSDVPFIEGLRAACYSTDELDAFALQPVLNNAGEPVVINLSHPTDDLQRPRKIDSCDVFTKVHKEGWYAPSSREMRREAYFVRACGTLDMLKSAKAPEETYFENGELSDADMRSLADGPPFAMTAASATAPATAEISKVSARLWTMQADNQRAQLQPIAHADFNDDGYGDILVFVSIGMEDGTAGASNIGLIEKTSADDPPRFEPKF